MAFLPKEALTLTGGCFCGACRYTIAVPALEDRPIYPPAAPTPISPTETVKTRVPIIDLDHCQMCRRVSGAIVQCWFICPTDWIKWELRTTDDNTVSISCEDGVGPTAKEGDFHLKRFAATDRATRSFCGKCGTNLTYMNRRTDRAPIIDITVGSLDQESFELAKPDRHGWWEFGTGWVKDLLTKGNTWLIKHYTGDVSKVVEE
jgi:hypothetical protein